MKNIKGWEKIDEVMAKGLRENVFPGAAVGICRGVYARRAGFIASYGYAAILPERLKMREDVFFDLASLTKPLATTLAVLALLKEKKIRLDENISSLLERTVSRDKRNITLQQLLGHCSGLPPYRPYFKDLVALPLAKRRETVIERILAEPLACPPGSCSQYSDLGFILLGMIVEKKAGRDLASFVRDKIYMPLGLEKKIFFMPLSGKGKKGRSGPRFAATEECPWRSKVLCGEVHDDNAYVLGGVAGHAGLFGNIKGVLKLTTAILDQWQGRSEHPNYLNSDLQKILTRQARDGENTWALGFDTPAAKGSSSGRYLAPTSVGHLGFTGTSFWIDRTKDLVIVLLTNRVHPRRDNERLKGFRPLFHDVVVKTLVRQTQGLPAESA